MVSLSLLWVKIYSENKEFRTMIEKIALQKRLITEDDYRKAVAACKAEENYEEALKEYFLNHNLLTREKIIQLDNTVKTLTILKSNIKFGDTAVKLGMIDMDSITPLLQEQTKIAAANKRPQFIGRLLMAAGKLTREQVLAISNAQRKKGGPTAAPQIPKQEAEQKPVENGGKEPSDQSENSGKVTEEVKGGMILDIDEHAMAAYLRKTDSFDNTLTVEDIYDILADRLIQFGLAKEHMIEGFIKTSGFKTNRFEVATGVQMIQGKNARIEYYFDTDYLKAGGMDEKGNIDFKDRGEIPKIEEDTLLAEKFPALESQDGKNIYGHHLAAEPAKDLELKSQSGAYLSDDGLRLYSQIKGYPNLGWSGNVNVLETFLVKEDVGYKTGHVTYDGDIDIKGCIKSGFKVTGHTIRVTEVDGGEIYATGDVTILNGANNARIYALGKVRVKFIHSSQISCLGDLQVEKEIVDSSALISGACKIEQGEIIACQIVANNGVFVKNLGTQKTQPNTIRVGQDLFVSRAIKKINEKIKAINTQKEKLLKRKETLETDNQRKYQAAARLSSELEKARITGISMLKPPEDGTEQPTQAKSTLKQNKAYFTRLNKDLNQLFNHVGQNEYQIHTICENLEDLYRQLDDLNFENENYMEWMNVNVGRPVVQVSGVVFSGTTVHGRHSSKETKNTRSRATFKEIIKSAEGGRQNTYEIVIHE